MSFKGCERRYCQLHKYEKEVSFGNKNGRRYYTQQSCCECGPEMEKDINYKQKFNCIIFISIIAVFSLIWVVVFLSGGDFDSGE